MRKRSQRVVVYFTKDEYDVLTNKVHKSGLNREAFLRRAVNEVQIMEAPHADVPLLLRELRRVGYNINEILKRINSGGIFDVPQFRKDMEDLRMVTKLIREQFTLPEK